MLRSTLLFIIMAFSCAASAGTWSAGLGIYMPNKATQADSPLGKVSLIYRPDSNKNVYFEATHISSIPDTSDNDGGFMNAIGVTWVIDLH